MAHFAARFGIGFAVKMQGRVAFARQGGHAQNIIADQVFHHHIGMARPVAQGPAGDGADMLFKLIDRAAILRPMAGIMHARGDFVDDQRRQA